MYYPTWFNNDAIWQTEQILGMVPRSNHHPYFHTMIIQFFFRIGYRLSGTITGGLAFYTFWQMTVMALVFAFILYRLYKRGTRLLWLFIALLFYAVLPFNAVLTICMGKDEFLRQRCSSIHGRLRSTLFAGKKRWKVPPVRKRFPEKAGNCGISRILHQGFLSVCRGATVFLFLWERLLFYWRPTASSGG